MTPRVWSQKAVAPKSRATITGCTPGALCVFRVAAIGSAGQGPWSDESVKMSP
ncbi:MAG: fibronectin type III domain-containing protein [Pedosphaera sp.]|nr:fibronectin type III domain-containing protein [Pedosphaera sp.]